MSAASDAVALRGTTWTLLAALLRAPPDAALLARLRALPAGDPGDPRPLAAAWAALRSAACTSAPETLAAEYQALFIGVGRGELVPYGSWYLTGFLMERPLGELRDTLARLGYARSDGAHEPEDHAGALCETLALLLADPDLTAEQATAFFAQHVDPWIGHFFADLENAPSAHFYRAVGRLGSAFVAFERRYLALPP
ncbi:TorA maturation chaperone TorD [Plasticicumulans lactativorans]|uniref:TorA maturation chaperone TorD n=1 Tax=Plasticicumulans lactativorans TaxID=1133106 RepID=A0A4R2L1N4_9GAMM|nr:molecular chaperone TorD family protein [Plasticicumulans lactativorans]TCO80941.1 TorA maturation chaperone TorD [Plasticicumulans lactativorans]